MMTNGEYRNWAELPPELTSSILKRLGTIEILKNAQKVCRSWRSVSKDPSMWRKIEIDDRNQKSSINYGLELMWRHAVDRSQGGLVDIDICYYGSDDLLNYIADSSSNLRRLRITKCILISDEGVAEAVKKLVLLEELDLSHCLFKVDCLRDVGQSCPNLKTLKLNHLCILFIETEYAFDDNAEAIAETMPQLRHLQLLGNGLTNTGLTAILDGCPHLEHLDLRQCKNINLVGDLKKRCLERIKELRLSDYDSESDSSSSSSTSLMKDEELRNWAELPQELMSSILVRVSSIDILENAQKVCRSWRHMCKDPSIWCKIDMHHLGDLGVMNYDLGIMCRNAVDLSQGGLVEIDIWYFGTDDLLNYIADRSRNLRRLSIIMCYPITNEGFVEAVVKLPLLEYLELSHCLSSGESLIVAGQSCPNLKTLKLNSNPDFNFYDDEFNNEQAVAIAESMPELRHLQLFGNRLTNLGLNAILDGCPHLEHLDLRKCFHVNFAGDLQKRCFESIKYLKRPNDSTAGYPYGSFSMNVDYDYYDYHGY